MKQHRSILMLFARSGLYPALGIILLGMLAQGGLFWLAYRGGDWESLRDLLADSRLEWAFGAAWLLLVAWLQDVGTTSEFTFRRLRVGRWALVGWKSLFCTLTLLLFWFCEILLMLALCQFYLEGQGISGGQGLLVTCYRVDFLHTLFPMRNWTRWVSNLFLLVGFGIMAGTGVGTPSRARTSLICILAGLTAFLYVAPMGGAALDAAWAVGGLLAGFVALLRVNEREEEELHDKIRV